MITACLFAVILDRLDDARQAIDDVLDDRLDRLDVVEHAGDLADHDGAVVDIALMRSAVQGTASESQVS